MNVRIKSVSVKSAIMLDVALNFLPPEFDGLINLSTHHITLLSIKTVRSLHNEEYLKIARNILVTPHPTFVKCKGFYRASRINKESVFTEVIEQDILKEYLNQIAPGLEIDRYFHISIANKTGNGFDSIGDITIKDKS